MIAMNTPHPLETEPTTGSLPPPELLRALEALRERLPVETELSELYELFDDRMVRTPALWSSSEPGHHDLLYGIVTTLAPRLRPGWLPMHDSFYEVRGTGFWHGAVYGTNAMACVFYDEGMSMGLIALCNPFDGSGQTHLVRITQVKRGTDHGTGGLRN